MITDPTKFEHVEGCDGKRAFMGCLRCYAELYAMLEAEEIRRDEIEQKKQEALDAAREADEAKRVRAIDAFRMIRGKVTCPACKAGIPLSLPYGQGIVARMNIHELRHEVEHLRFEVEHCESALRAISGEATEEFGEGDAIEDPQTFAAEALRDLSDGRK